MSITLVSSLAIPRSKKIGAAWQKTRRKSFNLATLKFCSSGKVLFALLSTQQYTQKIKEIPPFSIKKEKREDVVRLNNFFFMVASYRRGETRSRKRRWGRRGAGGRRNRTRVSVRQGQQKQHRSGPLYSWTFWRFSISFWIGGARETDASRRGSGKREGRLTENASELPTSRNGSQELDVLMREGYSCIYSKYEEGAAT